MYVTGDLASPPTYNFFPVTNPVVVLRADHSISRRRIDPDALRVLYRLHEHRYAAYLVGGSVRDLLLGRQPKDFDIGTDAHPYQIKRLFRNCWIIGRRFRLAHIKFGQKTIEVATFRRNIPVSGRQSVDIVVIPRRELLDASFDSLEADFLATFQRCFSRLAHHAR